jgi:hypothetical protein
VREDKFKRTQIQNEQGKSFKNIIHSLDECIQNFMIPLLRRQR